MARTKFNQSSVLPSGIQQDDDYTSREDTPPAKKMTRGSTTRIITCNPQGVVKT